MNYGSRRLTEGGTAMPCGGILSPCPWGPLQSSGGKEDESPPSATKQKSQPQWLAFLVDQALRISNLRFMEGLLEIRRFIEVLHR